MHKKPITPEAVCSTTSQLPTSDTHKRASGTCETCWKVGFCLLLTSHKKKTPPPEAIISSHLFKVNFVLWGFVVMCLRSSKGWWLMNVFHPRILCCLSAKRTSQDFSSVQTLYDPCVRWLNPPSVHSTAKSPTSNSTRSQKVLSEVHTRYDHIGGGIALLLDHWQQRWACDTATVTPHQSHRLIHLQKHYVNHSLSEAVFLHWSDIFLSLIVRHSIH